jgi:hypothetical protein
MAERTVFVRASTGGGPDAYHTTDEDCPYASRIDDGRWVRLSNFGHLDECSMCSGEWESGSPNGDYDRQRDIKEAADAE